MSRNERTPRTLADCVWHCGYRSARPEPARSGNPLLNWGLAIAVGVALGTLIARSI